MLLPLAPLSKFSVGFLSRGGSTAFCPLSSMPICLIGGIDLGTA